VEAKISEEDFANIKVGQKAATVIFSPTGPGIYHATVSKILPTADPETQRHLVDLEVTDIEPEKLIPGITGEVAITVGERQAEGHHPAPGAPQRERLCRQGRQGGAEKGQPRATSGSPGPRSSRASSPGEQVIVEDLDSFHDGDSVRVEELPSDAFGKKK
jgi:multidrug efflux pump subunit AcrA (membrane-fusion protein)